MIDKIEKQKTLPPDPDKFNSMRAKLAAKALHAHAPDRSLGYDVSALLTNLRHWCDRNDVVWAEALKAADVSYKQETRGIKPVAKTRKRAAK